MTARIVYRLKGISKHKIVYKTQHVIAGTKSSKNKDEAIEKQKQKYLTAEHSCSLLMIFTKKMWISNYRDELKNNNSRIEK